MILPIRYLVQPNNHGLTDVNVTLYSDTNATIATYNLIEIGTSSVYGLNVNITIPYCWAIVESVSINIKAIIRLAPSVVTISNDVSYLTQAETGTWKRTGSILDYYDSNMTIIAKYELQDSAGIATSDPTLVANRVRIGP